MSPTQQAAASAPSKAEAGAQEAAGGGVRLFAASNRNLWPRMPGTDFDEIADFAPNNSTFAAVPEPASWGLMILGLGALGAAMRGRRHGIASASV